MVSFFWYRTKLTIPANAAGFDTSGAMTVLRVNVDDYAEVWVDGVLPRAAGRPSPGTIQGFNMPHRLVLAIPSPRATNSRSRSSRSTGRFRPRRQISSGFARRRSSSSADGGVDARHGNR